MAEFADIASYQRGADLAAYARAGYDRVLVKASEGTGYVNPYVGPWWAAAGACGLARGAYHFANPSRWPGEAEADHFDRTLRACGGLSPRDWVCLDVEEPGQEGRAATHAARFCARMADLGYPDGVIYSGAYYLGPAGLTAAMLPGGWRRLHVANYNRVPDSHVPLPPGWGREQVVARQYTSSATQPGIPGRSDANRVVREWLGGHSPEETVTEQDKADIARMVLAALRNEVFSVQPPIRQDDKAGVVIGATYNKVGDVQRVLGGAGGVSEQVGLVGIAVNTGRQELAVVGGKVDALATMMGAGAASRDLLPVLASDTTLLERKIDALLDHLGIECQPGQE